jgi:methyltransferase family protein
MTALSELRARAAATVVQAYRDWRYERRHGFSPPPRWATLQSYEHILDTIERDRLWALGGDFVEIGVFLGGGTYQLAKVLERHAPDRRVYAIDIFDPDVDATRASDGMSMNAIYRRHLEGRDQEETYRAVVAACPNVVTIAGDSAAVELPTDAVSFAHIDGNHEPDYVRGDFELVWRRAVPGAVVAFDDYGEDLPGVRDAVDAIRRTRGDEIDAFWTDGPKTAFLRRRAP